MGLAWGTRTMKFGIATAIMFLIIILAQKTLRLVFRRDDSAYRAVREAPPPARYDRARCYRVVRGSFTLVKR